MPRRAQEGLWLLPWVKRGPGRLSDRGGTKDRSGFWGERSEKQDRNWGEASEAPGMVGGKISDRRSLPAAQCPVASPSPDPGMKGHLDLDGKRPGRTLTAPSRRPCCPSHGWGWGWGGAERVLADGLPLSALPGWPWGQRAASPRVTPLPRACL